MGKRARPAVGNEGLTSGGLGYKQQQATYSASLGHDPSASSSSASNHGKSYLATFLLLECMWGMMPAWKVNKIAELAVLDGLKHQEIIDIAKLGTNGLYKRNVYRGLGKIVKAESLERCIDRFEAPAKMPGDVIGEILIELLSPHALFATLHKDYPKEFRKRILGGCETNVSKFWDSMHRHPAYAGHPMLDHPRGLQHRTHAVPITLHGDGVATTGCGRKWARMVEVLNWTSSLCLGRSNSHNLFLITMVAQSLLLRREGISTMDFVWRHLCWSLYWLFMGVHPDRDANGVLYVESDGIKYIIKKTNLAGGYFGTLWVFALDLEWLNNHIHLTGPGEQCGLCRANSGDTPWTDCRSAFPWVNHNSITALWAATIWSDAAHLASHPSRHRIMRYVPGSNVHIFVPDLLHVKHLGVDKYFLGSVCRLILEQFGWAGTDIQKLGKLWNAIKKAYNDLGIHTDRVQTLTLKMIHAEGAKFPCLSVRGSQAKRLVPVLAAVVKDHMDVGNEQHNDVLAALQNSSAVDRILDRNATSYVLPEDDANELLRNAFEFCQVLTKLIRYYHPLNCNYFHMTIKTHWFLHFALIGLYINPAIGSCHLGEDFMKIVKRLTMSSASALDRAKCSQKAMRKYVKGLRLDLSGAFALYD